MDERDYVVTPLGRRMANSTGLNPPLPLNWALNGGQMRSLCVYMDIYGYTQVATLKGSKVDRERIIIYHTHTNTHTQKSPGVKKRNNNLKSTGK